MAWRTSPLPPDWPRIRARILTRDPHCKLRTHCWGAPSTEVDHADGGPDDHTDTNLRGVCTECHRHRTGQQGATAAHARRPTARRTPPRHPGIRQP